MGKRYNRIKRLVKEERALPSESISFSHGWRKKILREFGEWAPIETSGPANSTSTTFGYFAGGSPVINGETGQQVTFTYSGLDGVENYPTSVTIDQGGGDTFQTAPPPFSQVGVQGYTAKLNPRYAEAQKKYEEELKEWERKKEQQQKDIEATLNSLGTSLSDIQKNGGITRVGNSYVALMPGNTTKYDFGSNLMNNIRIVRLVPYDSSKPMELARNVKDADGKLKNWNVSNSQISNDIYLGIGEPPKEPIEQEYLMPRRTDFKDVNPQLDASQEFAQKVGADTIMNARVQDVIDGLIPNYTSTPDAPTDPNAVTPEDEAFIDYMERYPGLVNFLLPGQAAAATSVIDYARGNYRNITQSPGRSANKSILNIISRIHKPGQRGGSVTAGLNPGGPPSNIGKAYPTDPVNAVLDAPMRNFLNQFNYEVTSDGVRIIDNFNFNGNRNTGALGNIPIKGPDGRIIKIQDVASRLAEIGDKRARSMGLNPSDDSLGAKIDFTIPWSQVPAKLQNQLDPTQTISPIVKRNRRGRVVESTWSRIINKYRSIKEHQTPYTGKRNLTGGWRKKIISDWREELIDEGMSSKDFPDLYGYGISIFDMPITSTIQNPVQSTKAQDIVDASADATDHEFGPQFPGSYRNVVGGVQSLSKVDAQAHITSPHGATPNEGEMPHPEDHVFTYQSEGNSIKWPTEYTFPDSFSDDLAYFDAEGNPQEWISYIWPVHGHPGNYTPLNSAKDDSPFWGRISNATSWGGGDSDGRMQYNDGRIDRRSITDTSFDVTYGAARSIDSSAFDLTGNMDEQPWAEGYETDYNIDVNDIAELNALRAQWRRSTSETGLEDWQYIRSNTETDYIDQIYGIDLPFAEYDYSPYESDHGQFTGTDGWDRIHPNLNTTASWGKKIIKNVQVGDKISFSYKWYSDTWLYNTENYADYYAEDYIIDGVRYGDHDWNSSYFRGIIGASNRVVSIKDQWQMIGADPSLTLTDGTYTIPPLPNPNNPEDNPLNNDYNITKKDNGFSFPYNGTYEYIVQEGDIDAAGLFQFTTMLLAESTNLEYVQITNFAHTVGDRTRTAAGQLGKTTDAYNLGTSVASLNPNEKYQKNKKKKDKEEQERRKIEQERLEKEKQETDSKDTITKGGKTYDKETYSVLGPYTPSVDKVKDYPTYSDIKGQTEPPEPGSHYYTSYYRFYVPKQGPEYEAWLSSIPAEQADKIRDTKQKEDPAANQRYVSKFQMFGKPKLYGKYGDKSYYNPADTGQEVSNQVKITWDPYGSPNRQDRFGQRLANPGEKQDSYGFPLGKDEEESDYTYWKGKRYLKGSYDDTAEIDPKTGKFRGNFSWFAEKDPASAKTGNSDTMSTKTNWKGPRAAWGNREFVGLGPNEEIEQVIQYRKHYDLMREKYGRLRDIPQQYHKNNNYLESLARLVVATMPKDWARPFVPADDDMPDDEPQFDKEQLGIEDFENKSDYDAYKAGGGDAARKNGMSVDDIIAQGRKNLESSDSDDPYHLNLGQIIKKFGNKIGNELAKISQKLSTYRHAGEAFANFLLQQQGITNYTKKNPYNVKLPRKDALALAKTINNVLETQIPRERWNDLSQEDLDLINDAANPESGPTPTNKYREGTGANRDEYHNIFNNLGERKGVKVKVINGKPYVTELNDNYVFTDPDDATVQGAPELIKFFTTAGGAQDREDAAGGGEYTYQQYSGDINNLDLKMKNMPIRMKLPIPTGGQGKFKDVSTKRDGDEIAQEPKSRLQKGLEKQERDAGPMAPMPTPRQPGGGNMPTPSVYDLLDQDPKRTTLAKKTKNSKNKQPVVSHYEPKGEMVVDQALYPGQPSPSGFPDTPPPELAPNGYHPQFGKKADRYRRLDSISAKTMDRVKTGDSETDAQVSAAAKSVFERFKKYR